MSRTVLVLGGGSGQLTLLNRLAEAGIRIVLQDRNPGCPGRLLADVFMEADTADAESASRAAVEHRVDGVLTAGTDQPVLAAAIACRERGCPALHSQETAKAVTDKETMKRALADAGIPVPAFRILGADNPPPAPGEISWPRVVKPVDSQGQRGVVRIDSEDGFAAAREAALGWSRRKRIIVEAYREHREVTVSGWVHRGEVRTWAVTDRVTRDFPPHIGLCMAHRYPSAYASGREQEVWEITRRSTEVLGITEGPIYHQLLITDDGIMVNECAARLGGAYEEVSLPPACGIDPIGLLIAGSLEGSADPYEDRFHVPVTARAFTVPLMFCRPGRISSLKGTRQVRALPGVTDFAFLQPEGTVIKPLRNSVQRAAWMAVHGPDIPAVNRTLKKAVSRIGIFDSRGRQLLRNPLGYAGNLL